MSEERSDEFASPPLRHPVPRAAEGRECTPRPLPHRPDLRRRLGPAAARFFLPQFPANTPSRATYPNSASRKLCAAGGSERPLRLKR